MAQRAENTRAAPPKQQTWLGRVVSTAFQGFFWVLAAVVFSVLTEWIGLTFFWPEQGIEHSHQMLIQELDYLGLDFTPHPLVGDAAEFAAGWADTARYWVFDRTGLTAAADWAAGPSDGRFHRSVQVLYETVKTYLWSAWYIVQVVAVRLAVLTLAMPAFLMTAIAALADGLTLRDLRRFGSGRESGFVYHWAKRFIAPSLILPWVIYLALPWSVHPNFVVLPFCALFGLAVTVAASMFKKYL